MLLVLVSPRVRNSISRAFCVLRSRNHRIDPLCSACSNEPLKFWATSYKFLNGWVMISASSPRVSLKEDEDRVVGIKVNRFYWYHEGWRFYSWMVARRSIIFKRRMKYTIRRTYCEQAALVATVAVQSETRQRERKAVKALLGFQFSKIPFFLLFFPASLTGVKPSHDAQSRGSRLWEG